jgi:hypothetical protein
LCSREKIYVDGTFHYCQKCFKRLFTIHVVKNGSYIPLVFILLPNKNSQTYFEAFKLVRNFCISVNLCLEPTEIVCDFAKAVGVKNFWSIIIYPMILFLFRKYEHLVRIVQNALQNACESFHSFYVPQLNIFKFIEILKDVQLYTYIKLNSTHLPVSCKNSQYKKRYKYVTNLIKL